MEQSENPNSQEQNPGHVLYTLQMQDSTQIGKINAWLTKWKIQDYKSHQRRQSMEGSGDGEQNAGPTLSSGDHADMEERMDGLSADALVRGHCQMLLVQPVSRGLTGPLRQVQSLANASYEYAQTRIHLRAVRARSAIHWLTEGYTEGRTYKQTNNCLDDLA